MGGPENKSIALNDRTHSAILDDALKAHYEPTPKVGRRRPRSNEINGVYETIVKPSLDSIAKALAPYAQSALVSESTMTFEDDVNSCNSFSVVIGPNDFLCEYSLSCETGSTMSKPIVLRLDAGKDLEKVTTEQVTHAFIDLLLRRHEMTRVGDRSSEIQSGVLAGLNTRLENIENGMPAESGKPWTDDHLEQLKAGFKDGCCIEKLAMIFEKVPLEIAIELRKMHLVGKNEVQAYWKTDSYQQLTS